MLAFASNAAAWRARIGGDTNSGDAIEAVGVFANGDVVAVGSLQYESTADDFLAMRFQARTGRVLWRLEIDGDPGPFLRAVDGAWVVAVARNGDAVVGGAIAGPTGDPDATILRLHGRSGRERWRAIFHLPDSPYIDLVRQVLMHPSGDVVAILLQIDEHANQIARVVRLDGRTGAVRWQREVADVGCSHDCGVLDVAGNLVMAGRDYDHVADRFVARAMSLDGETGAPRWQADVPELNVWSVAYGPDGAVVFGGTESVGADSHGAVARLDRTGVLSWRRAFGGTYSNVSRVDVAADGDVLAGGTIDDEVFATRLDAATGHEAWRTTLRRLSSDASLGWARVLAFADDRRGGVLATVAPEPYGLGDVDGAMLALDGATGAERWRARLGGDELDVLVRSRHGFVVGAGITRDDPFTPTDAVVVVRDARDGTDVAGSKPQGRPGQAHGPRVP